MTEAPTYANVNNTKPGHVLIADGDFDCLHEGDRCLVKCDDEGNHYVDCEEGQHLLDGQLNEKFEYVGFTHA